MMRLSRRTPARLWREGLTRPTRRVEHYYPTAARLLDRIIFGQLGVQRIHPDDGANRFELLSVRCGIE